MPNILEQKAKQVSEAHLHRLEYLIKNAPEDTTKVRQGIRKLGITKNRLYYLEKNPDTDITAQEALKLIGFFGKYPELGIKSIEDLFQKAK